MNRLRNILALILALVLMMGIGVCRAAEIYVVEDTILYTGILSARKEEGKISAGTKVRVVSYNDTWAELEIGGKKYYVRTEDLAVKKEYSGKTVYLKEKAELYRELGSSARIRTLSKGEAVKLYATAGAWAYVKAGSDAGIVKTDMLTAAKPAEKSSSSIQAYVKKNGAKAYKSASTSAKVLCSLNANDTVEVTAVKGNWCTVQKNGYTGYMKKSDLAREKVSAVTYESFTGYVTRANAEVYKSANRNAEVLSRCGINQKVSVVAYNESWYAIRLDSGYGFMPLKDVSRTPQAQGVSSASPAKGKAAEKDWWKSDIQELFAVGVIVTVTDVETGIAWKEIRCGGENHADCEPLTSADTAAMKEACGGWSWDRRAVFVTIGGKNYAASINAKPHGSSTISDNKFGGHHCIHFTNSRTHSSDSVCQLHQTAIREAANTVMK